MYTIIMNDDKSLRKGSIIKIYQREKLVNKIQFLLPLTYGNFDLGEFSVILKYIDQGNLAHAEILVPSEQLYQNIRRIYTVPIDTNLTKFAGDITIHLTFSKFDADTGKQYVMHSGKTNITISPLEDLYAFVTDESLEVLDSKILELEAKIQAADLLVSKQADDLILTDDVLKLSAGNLPIGNGVKIPTSSGMVDSDGIPIVDFSNTTFEPPLDGDDVIEF